jgi:hypothetical protein
VNKDDVGYEEYLESLNIKFSPKEERWVRWKLDVRINIPQSTGELTRYSW